MRKRSSGCRSGPGLVAGSGRHRWLFCWIVLLLASLAPAAGLAARQVTNTIDLTVQRMVDLTLSSSYQVQYLNMRVEQTRQRLRAERARLRSSVALDLSVPDFQAVSETEYNSLLGRNEIVRQNSRQWEAQLSIRQPVILFGYPTNGYLSLNNRVYRYTQLGEEGDRDVTYYNRYFIRYTQPLFQPNTLKNDLEEAQLDLEESEIQFADDVLEIVDDALGDYYELFENAYEQVIGERHVTNLTAAEAIARQVAEASPERAIELDQIRIELANARENLQRERSDYRLRTAQLKTRLKLADSDVLSLDPVMEMRPVEIDLDRAVRYARELTPRLRRLAIQMRESEIELDETKGRNAFRANIELTYGREMRDPTFGQLWNEPSDTYTLDVNAYVPIWDWGEREARIEASRINLQRTALQMEEAEVQIVSNVENEIRNVQELQQRALSMQENEALAMRITQESLALYERGAIGVADLMQTFRRQMDTSENFLEAYLGWRQSLRRLQQLTYYDFEHDMPVLDRFGIDVSAMRSLGNE